MCMPVQVYDVCRDAQSPGAGATDCGEPPNVLGAQVMFSAERVCSYLLSHLFSLGALSHGAQQSG